MAILLHRILVWMSGLTAITAIAGGAVLVIGQSLMPLNWLAGSPFTTYLIPGLILIVVVGGTQLLAAINLWRRAMYQDELLAVAAFGLIIWIIVQLWVIRQTSFLQAAYLGIGMVELVGPLIELKYFPPRSHSIG